jgi:hypothetical protein
MVECGGASALLAVGLARRAVHQGLRPDMCDAGPPTTGSGWLRRSRPAVGHRPAPTRAGPTSLSRRHPVHWGALVQLPQQRSDSWPSHRRLLGHRAHPALTAVRVSPRRTEVTARKCPSRWAQARNPPKNLPQEHPPCRSGSAVRRGARARWCSTGCAAWSIATSVRADGGVVTGEQPATPRAAPQPFRAWRTAGSAGNIHSRPPRRRCPAACGCGSRAPAPRG